MKDISGMMLFWFFANVILHKALLGKSFEDAVMIGAIVAVLIYVAHIVIGVIQSKYE